MKKGAVIGKGKPIFEDEEVMAQNLIGHRPRRFGHTSSELLFHYPFYDLNGHGLKSNPELRMTKEKISFSKTNLCIPQASIVY